MSEQSPPTDGPAEAVPERSSLEDLGPKISALGLVGIAAVVALTLGPSIGVWGDGATHVIAMGLVLMLTAMVLAVWRGGAFERRGVAIAVLCATFGLLVAQLGGMQLRHDPWPDLRFVGVMAAVLVVTIGGLALRRRWARWTAMSLAIAAGGMVGIRSLFDIPPPGPRAWAIVVMMLGSGIVLTSLAGRTMANDDAPDETDFTRRWSDQLPVVWWLRGTILSSLVAAPTLLLYAWVQPGAIEALGLPAVGLAVTIVVGVWLVMSGRAVGALVMSLAGAGLLVFVLALIGLVENYQRGDIGPYLVFWLPAACMAVARGAALVRGTGRLLREG